MPSSTKPFVYYSFLRKLFHIIYKCGLKKRFIGISVTRKVEKIKEDLGQEVSQPWVYAKLGKLNREAEKCNGSIKHNTRRRMRLLNSYRNGCLDNWRAYRWIWEENSLRLKKYCKFSYKLYYFCLLCMSLDIQWILLWVKHSDVGSENKEKHKYSNSKFCSECLTW